MAGQQSADQKTQDAAAKKAADDQAAAQKAAADRAAAERAAVTAEADRVAAAVTAAEQLQVIGPVAVLPLKAGGERYVYRGAPVDEDTFTEAGIKHATAIGLVGKPKPQK